MALYEKKDRYREGGRLWIGRCDTCGLEVATADRHWIVLWPGEDTLKLVCWMCREDLREDLRNDEWLDDSGVLRIVYNGQKLGLDEIDRKLMLDQLDDDEMLQDTTEDPQP